jgi:hypothetical protein
MILQTIQALAGPLITLLILVPGFAMTLAAFCRDPAAASSPTEPRDRLIAIGVGVAAAGLIGLAQLPASAVAPAWPRLDAAAAQIPALGVALDALQSYLMRAAALLSVFGIGAALSRGWTRRRALVVLWFLVAGFAFAGRNAPASLPTWLAEGSAISAVMIALDVWLFRHCRGLVPVAYAAFVIAGLAHDAWPAAYPGALVGNLLAVCLVVAAAWLCLRWSEQPRREMAA